MPYNEGAEKEGILMPETATRCRFLILGLAVAFISACASDGDGDLTSDRDRAGRDAGVDELPLDRGDYKRGSQDHLDAVAGSLVYFGYDRYDLTARAQNTLRKQAEWLLDNARAKLSVAGHADERGTREYNLALGARRAEATKNFLVALGVSASRIRTISYGKEKPVVPGSNESAWSQNRRSASDVR